MVVIRFDRCKQVRIILERPEQGPYPALRSMPTTPVGNAAPHSLWI
jgi:hypothetical protein